MSFADFRSYALLNVLGPTMRYSLPSKVKPDPLRFTNVDGRGLMGKSPSPGPYTAPPAVLVYWA